MFFKSKSYIFNKNLLRSFDENGYIILDLIDKKKLNEVKKDLYIMTLDSLKNNAPEFISKNNKKLKNKNFILHDGLIYLEKKNHKLLSKIYDVIAKTTSFLNLICDKRIVEVINYLLRKKKIAICISIQIASGWICQMIKNFIMVGIETTILI